MLNSELSVLEELKKENQTVSEIAESISKSQSWTSELIKNLKKKNLIETNKKIHIADTYEATVLTGLIDRYDIQKILSGRKEDILLSLLRKPKEVSGLERRGFPRSTVYRALKELRESGVVAETEEGYDIVEEDLRDFLKAIQRKPFQRTYSAGDEKLIETKKRDMEGDKTAFSTFKRYGVGYLPVRNYFYKGEKSLSLEDVLIHAVVCAKNKKQTAMCCIFYLKHRGSLEMEKLWRLASRWDSTEKWADLMAFVDRRDLRNPDLFLPWEEFNRLLEDYEVKTADKYFEETILENFGRIGKNLEENLDVFLLGGANLILRGLKDSTKDIDVVLEDRDSYESLVKALEREGYREKHEFERVYENLEPSGIFQKGGGLRWDVFVRKVAGALRLTTDMKNRVDKEREFGKLKMGFLSPTDIFLFKSVTDREGDFEDAALLARKGLVDWEDVLKSVKEQERVTGRYFSFAVLDTLDVLSEAYNVEVPIHGKLLSYVLEQALVITLQKPKTIKDLRRDLDFPDHQIYNKLNKLEEEGKVEVDRSGKLNVYRSKEKI